MELKVKMLTFMKGELSAGLFYWTALVLGRCA